MNSYTSNKLSTSLGNSYTGNTVSEAYPSPAQPSNAPVAKSAPTEPRCKELLKLWYKKSKINVIKQA